MKMLFLIVFCILASVLNLKYLAASYVWIAVLWFAVFLYATISDRRSNAKAVWFNIGFCFIALGGIEAYLWISPDDKDNIRNEGSYTTEKHIKLDDILGYAPVKGKAVTSLKYRGEEVIYDATYTIDSGGLRITPSDEENQNKEGVLFFGGSFTFGEGVNDHETMPYVVGTKLGYKVYNFGFHGYGPHQMLAALEQGVVKNIAAGPPRFAIYQALFTHVKRAAGYSQWDKHGPRYVLLPDGHVSFVGHFDDDKPTEGPTTKSSFSLGKSFIYRRFFAKAVRIRREDIDLYVAIVDAARKRFEEDYPGAAFHVIFWDEKRNKNYKRVVEGLKAKGIRVHLISDILPGYPDNVSMYEIGPDDGHPNPMTHKLVAEYVADHILGE